MMGYEMEEDDEVMLIFGGVALRDVVVDGKELFNNCTP